MKPFLRILLPAAVCGLLLGACTQRQTTLKFMSYNIRNGRGIDNVQDLGRVAEIINRTAPDIVALQELDSVTGRMAGRFIPGELGEMTGMHARFCRAIDYDGGAYGVGLLSRDEPLAVRRIPLPGREESRVLFVAEFPDYVVCVTHLSLTPEDQRASLPIIRTVTDTCRKPVLLVFVVAVRCHCLTSLLAGRQVISSPFAHYSSAGGTFWLACLGKLQKNIFTAHSLCSFRFVRVDRPDRNERAVSGTGGTQKRPDSMKLFERKKHDIQLKSDDFRNHCQTVPVGRSGFF